MANNSIVKTIRNLGPLAAAITQAAQRAQSNLYQAPTHRIDGVDDSHWPSALQPVMPIGPKGSVPLVSNFYVGQNLIYTPRSDAEYKAEDLKRLADYPLARICIENVKDTMCALPKRIQAKKLPGESKADHEKRQLNDKNIAFLNDFFDYPNSEQDWPTFLRPVLEDMLVLDAASIFMRRNKKGDKILELHSLPGETITRYIDDAGMTPQPPSVAYAQIWNGGINSGSGIPRVEFTTDQLLYRPRNIVRGNTNSSQLYGLSPCEQLAPEIKIGIERLKYVLAYYISGSTNGVVQIIPNGTPPDKIREAIEAYNSAFAGDLAAKRQLKWLQGFSQEPGKDQIITLPEPVLADIFDDLHIRKLCFGFGTSPQRLLRMMNRATAEQNQESAEEEGLKPWIVWLTGVMNYLIQRKFGMAGYEMVFDIARDADALKQAQADEIDVKSGIRVINEVRQDRGLDPLPQPEASMPGIITANGFIPLEGSAEAAQTSRTAAAQPKEPKDKSGKQEPDGEEDEDPAPAEKLAKAATPTINPRKRTRVGRAAEKSISRTLHRKLIHLGNDFLEKLKGGYKVSKLAKADDKEKRKELIESWLATLDWSDIPEDIEDDLAEVSIEASSDGVAVWDITERAVINSVNARAAGYARNRAAEMVGKKWVDGELVDNPDAKWAISETTRNKLREILTDAFEKDTPLNELIQSIQETDLFSETRAKMIAKTEVSMAQVIGNLDGWKSAGVVETINWRLAGNHTEPDECDDNAENGPYTFDELPEYPNHPNELCLLVPAKLKGEKDEDAKKAWDVRIGLAKTRMAA